jgi:hypothetical protein
MSMPDREWPLVEVHARADLVFIQNGMLQPWLDEKGLGDNTQVGTPAACMHDRYLALVFLKSSGGSRLTRQPWQVLVYFAVAKKGEMPTDGKTDLNPEGLTAAYGAHAESIAGLLHSNGLSCSVPSHADFVKAMLEKLVWIW